MTKTTGDEASGTNSGVLIYGTVLGSSSEEEKDEENVIKFVRGINIKKPRKRPLRRASVSSSSDSPDNGHSHAGGG